MPLVEGDNSGAPQEPPGLSPNEVAAFKFILASKKRSKPKYANGTRITPPDMRSHVS